MTRPTNVTIAGLAALCLLGAGPALAQEWEPFRSPNPNVEEGNAALAQNDAAGALAAYDRAARELPSEAGVHLDRGIALAAARREADARTALLAATEPPATAEVRAAAYYNMGLSFYRDGDAAAGSAAAEAARAGQGTAPGAPAPEADHREATRLFREAADAFRRSLRARPRNRDAAWNLELALRRIREEEQRQREQEEQQQQNQDQQNQDQQNQDQQNQDQQQQQNQDQQQQQNQDQPNQDQQQQQNQDQQQQQDQGEPQTPEQQEPQQQEQQGQPPGGGQQQQPEEQPSDVSGEQLPADMARVLDSLRDSEDNLERYRARMRAQREQRRLPTKDW